jgi:integrase
VSYFARKTGKDGLAPIPTDLRPILVRLVANRGGRLFQDRNIRGEWENIRIRAGLYRLKPGETLVSKKRKTVIYEVDRQDFRKTFSTLIQKTSGLSSAQQLLQHSSERVTTDYYTDTALLLAWRVEQLPVKQWISWAFGGER